jgi:MOSC domain-containing protein YiiM
MAVHLYPLDHHAFWQNELGPLELLDQPGAFGSNLAVRGIIESAVHIGDRFRVGTALLEVSQPRQPCWKIEHRFGCKGMVARIIETGRSGWYFRVIEPGEMQAGDGIERIAVGEVGWSVERAFRALVAGKASLDDFAELAAMQALSPKLRDRAQSRLG